MRILVVNAGSSTLKLQVIDDDELHAAAVVDPWDGGQAAAIDALRELVDASDPVDAIGHRVVHGGDLDAPTRLDDDLVERLRSLAPLAPLHQPRALAGIEAARTRLPGAPHVACFDTAFHATMPAAARTYAVPSVWRERWGIRRYGFHGLSHAWAARRAAVLAAGARTQRIVTCHLGAGASLCAVLDGRSVDTTMGFTPLEGLVMATRSGSVDPGLVLWLLREAGLSAAEVSEGLERGGGLAGLSGTSGDLRDVTAAIEAGDDAAQLALDVYVHRLRREVAAMAAALGGLDVLAFTGGVGEHATAVRATACDGLAFLGVELDPARNDATTSDGDISGSGASVRTVVVSAREDLEIAHEVRSLLS